VQARERQERPDDVSRGPTPSMCFVCSLAELSNGPCYFCDLIPAQRSRPAVYSHMRLKFKKSVKKPSRFRGSDVGTPLARSVRGGDAARRVHIPWTCTSCRLASGLKDAWRQVQNALDRLSN
jgi:hypothetical protein